MLAYLVHDVFERIGAVDGEADEDDVGLWVGQWPQSVVLLLSSRVPERQLDHLACGWVRSVGDVILKHGGHIFLACVSVVKGKAGCGGRTSGKLPEL